MSRFLRILTIAASAMVAAKCGGSGGNDYGSPAAPTPQQPASAAVTIAIVANSGAQSFNPSPGTVPQGQTLSFRNADGAAHRIVFNDNSYDTGNIAPGATSEPRAVPANGANYHCTIHPGMIGSISGAAGQPPPECTGQYCQG